MAATEPIRNKKPAFLEHVTVTERKTGKTKTIALNAQILGALRQYRPQRRSEFIFYDYIIENHID